MSMILLMLFLLFLAVRRTAGCLGSSRSGYRKCREEENPEQGTGEDDRGPMTGAREAFAELTGQVTELVKKDYPEAAWIWEEPDAMQEVMLGGDVHIILSRAGGYRRAKVICRNLKAAALDYRMEKEAFQEGPQGPEPEEPVEDNYELLAFQWTEANLPELSERCSEAASQGKNEVLIPLDELPAPESWQDICRELVRNRLPKVKIVTDGILVLL